MAKPLELADEPPSVALDLLLIAALEVEIAELVVGDAPLQHGVGGDEDRVGAGDRRLRVAAVASEPGVVSAQVGALAAPEARWRWLGKTDMSGPISASERLGGTPVHARDRPDGHRHS